MVCTSIDSQTGKPTRSSIAGGFVLVPVASTMTAWRACRSRPLGIGDFRTWLAAHEMQARRCKLDDARQPTYTIAELAGLLGVTRKRAGGSLRRLQAANLIEWTDERIEFPDQADAAIDDDLADTIGRGRGQLAIPRRVLRFLANGARPALIATVLGVILRCLSRRRDGFDGRGRIKAGWIARVFDVDLRGVKRARRELVRLGWISEEPSDSWATRRWGSHYRIDLGWEADRTDGPRLPPIPASAGPAIATPRSDPEPLRERNQNQEPAPGGPAGAQLSGNSDREGKIFESAWRSQSELRRSTGGGTARDRDLSPRGKPERPRLDDVTVEDLKDTERLLELQSQAVARGVVDSSEAARLRVFAAAEHALAVGQANPPGLFSHLIRGRLWRYLTQSDEDKASRRLKARERVVLPMGSICQASERRRPTDAEVVRSVRDAAIRAGVFRDPWAEFQRQHPEWTRSRWDAAMEAMG